MNEICIAKFNGKLPSSIQGNVIRRCFRWGAIKNNYLDAVKNNYPLKTYVAYFNGKIVGWGIAYRFKYYEYMSNKEKYDDWNFMLYISEKYRRKGIGSEILKSAKRSIKGKIVVHPHDNRSYGFFNNNSRRLEY